MSDYLSLANSLSIYLVVGGILLFVTLLCFIFIVKSYRAGIKLGMEGQVLRKAIFSSATFTVLPSVSILLGVIALSGSLGVPVSWLRLSVIGNLQYEATVASVAAESMGTTLDAAKLTMDHLVTIMSVMTVGIIWGCLLSIFTLKLYSNKLSSRPKLQDASGIKKQGFANWAMAAMFIGLCATFLGSYVGKLFVYKDYIPVCTAIISALCMGLFQYLIKNKGYAKLESFSLAVSMLVGMACAIFIGMI